jgi:hypothetical protein
MKIYDSQHNKAPSLTLKLYLFPGLRILISTPLVTGTYSTPFEAPTSTGLNLRKPFFFALLLLTTKSKVYITKFAINNMKQSSRVSIL